jgi:hypothetical protein
LNFSYKVCTDIRDSLELKSISSRIMAKAPREGTAGDGTRHGFSVAASRLDISRHFLAKEFF